MLIPAAQTTPNPLTVRAMEAAFFDLDKTVIAKASVAAFGRTLYNEGLITRRLLLRTAVAHLIFLQMGAGHERMEKMRRSMLSVVRGWQRSRVEEIVREALEDVLEPIIYEEALDLIKEHQKAGRKVVIISSSPQEIVRPLSEFLGADDSIGSRASVDDDGKYTGELEFYAYAQHKADAIGEMAKAENIDLTASFAYSDSHTDTPMLNLVGHPVVVNPDRELETVANQKGWPVTRFTHPMPLRDQRSALRFQVAGYLVIASIGLLGGALFSVWRLHRRASILRSLISSIKQ
jgi:HAD superfamily hydrolase (TIGR01490 family)